MAPRLDSLTSLRFLAAMMVVITHLTFVVDMPKVERALAEPGYTGVGFFFVLSGFVLTWSHRDGDRSAAFYRRRFARIYPLHLLTWAVGVLLTAGVASRADAAQNVVSLTLVQAWLPTERFIQGPNPPSWSLSAEVFFYAMFPLLIVVLRRVPDERRQSVGIALFAASVAAAASTGQFAPRVLAGLVAFPPYRLVWFALGILLALSVQQGYRCRVPAPAVLGVFLLSYLLCVPLGPQQAVLGELIMLPAWILIIAAAASRDLNERELALGGRWGVRLGAWSFALYLSHHLLFRLAAHRLPGWSDLPFLLSLAYQVALVCSAIALSAGLYYVVERPLEASLRGGRKRSEEAAV